MMHAAEPAEEFALSIWHKFQSWKVIHFSHLPQWLQDNDFLHFGHRPPLPTSECFKSIIRIHTETGNIWTHLLGVVAFIGLASFLLSRPSNELQLQEKLVFACFFIGAITCMGLSFLYHTLCCNKNKKIGRLFAKFDYCGISFLTVGSFVPWLYYSFYCDWKPQVIYLSIVIVLGIGAVVVSTFDFFAGPRFRPLRAGVFIFFGLSGIAPATHFGIVNGWERSVEEACLGWLILMGILYITGALLYAMRIPERFFPGKLDIWFHSHQIFHCFVIAGAFVHYHGISLMALYRLQKGDCPMEPVDEQCIIDSIHNSLKYSNHTY
jgi:adiponectin receptor